MPFYPAADHDVQPAPAPGAVVCRCCPGGISRSTRPRRYPSDMTEAEWAVCEPLLPGPAWLACGARIRECDCDLLLFATAHGCQAAIWYSWVRPPRICFRWTRCSARSICGGRA